MIGISCHTGWVRKLFWTHEYTVLGNRLACHKNALLLNQMNKTHVYDRASNFRLLVIISQILSIGWYHLLAHSVVGSEHAPIAILHIFSCCFACRLFVVCFLSLLISLSHAGQRLLSYPPHWAASHRIWSDDKKAMHTDAHSISHTNLVHIKISGYLWCLDTTMSPNYMTA